MPHSSAARAVSAVLIGAVLAQPITPSIAQDLHPPLILTATAPQIFAELKREIVANAKPAEAGLIASIEIHINAKDPQFFNVKAAKTFRGRTIDISGGFLEALAPINIAYAEILTFGSKEGQFRNFIEYFVKWLREPLMPGTDKRAVQVKSFCEYTGHGTKACELRRRDQRFLNTLGYIVKSAYSFVLLHETAHHLLKHVDSGASDPESGSESSLTLNPNQEAAADELATAMLVERKQLVNGAMGALFLMSFIKGPDGMGSIENGYPHPLCRWINVSKTQYKTIMAHPNVAEFFEKKGLSIEDEKRANEELQSSVRECASK